MISESKTAAASSLSRAVLLVTWVVLAAASPLLAGTIYVDDDAPLGGDGQTWLSAYKYLQDALAVAVAGDEIWVAAGTYRPDQDEAGNVTPGDRNSAFKLRNNVAIYGGFVGGETDLSQRPVDPDPSTIDPATDSVLSGDIGTPGETSDNCYHVFYHPSGTNLDNTAVLDGFAITGGKANGSGELSYGGGMFNLSASPTVTNCTFSGNSAEGHGGGMYNFFTSSPIVTNCTFTGDSAGGQGGGMYNYFDCNPTVTNCTFTGNWADLGGGVFCYEASPTISNNTITENGAGNKGGGIYCAYGSPTITNNTIMGNTANSAAGGGIYCAYGSPTIANNTITNNVATYGGGVCCNIDGTITACEFRNNSAYFGGGIRVGGYHVTVEGCTFEQNHANKTGGGLSSEETVLAVRDCLFRDNSAWAEGGAAIIVSGSAVMERSRFVNNTAGWWGGGLYLKAASSAEVIGCLLTGNEAWDGGGLRTDGRNHALINCVFSGNRSTGGGDYGGGGIAAWEPSLATITNCTFSGNQANNRGGGVDIHSGSYPTIQNSIFWQNSDLWGNTEKSQIWFPAGENPPVVRHCCVQGWSGAWGGTGNTGTDPLLSADFRLQAGSSSIDAGKNDVDTNAFSPEHELLPDKDYAGNPRFLDDPDSTDTGNGVAPLVDRGAFEFVPPDCNNNDILDECDLDCGAPGGVCDVPGCGTSHDCNGNAIPDRCERDCNGNGLHDDCDIAAGAPDCDGDGVPDVPGVCESDTDGDGIIDDCDNCPLIHNPEQDSVCELPNDVVCVRTGARGVGDGTDWYNCFQNLQDALAAARAPGSSIREIWVASGTYYPDRGVGQTPGERSATFQLVDGVSICGGFAGTETGRDQRDPSIHIAYLSGDLNPEDVQQGNSRHVVTTNSGVGPGTVVDGFRIVKGLAEGGNADGDGAGWYNVGGSPTVVNCVFEDHLAVDGGGLFTASGNPTITDCQFRYSTAYYGGGVHVSGGSPTIEGCTFEQNHGKKTGGGLYMYTDGGPLVIRDCLFRENSVWAEGAGVQILRGSAVIEGSRFVDNTAGWWGGGVHLASAASAKVIGCLLAGNEAWDGAGLRTDGSDHAVINCVFSDNHSTGGGEYGGGGISVWKSSWATITNCTFAGNQADNRGGGVNIYPGGHPTIQNSIFWQNSDGWGNAETSQIWFPAGEAPPVIAHCRVQGWSGAWGGTANTGDAPLWTLDRHLRAAASSFINAGNNGAVPLEVTTDFDGQPEVRIFNGTVDIGADEFNDSDGDGLPDWWEAKVPAASEPGDDVEGDGLTNLQEYELFSSNPIAPPIYVCNNCDPSPDGTDGHPWGTIQTALDAASDGDTILVLEGIYAGAGNRDLNFKHKSVIVRSWNGTDPCQPANAVIDCGGTARAINPELIKGGSAALKGFTIINGGADLGGGIGLSQSRLVLEDCVINNSSATTEGGGIHFDASDLMVGALVIGPGNAAPGGMADAGVIKNSSVGLLGDLTVTEGRLDVLSSWFYGPGTVYLSPDSLLSIAGTSSVAPAVVRSRVAGTGDILINPGYTLRVENGAVVDLSGAEPTAGCGNCPTSDPSTWGTITIGGALVVSNATIKNTNVKVTLADLEGATGIINNDISLVEATTGFGGQFFVEGSTSIECNRIQSEGDRYLDLDPDADDRNLNICQNTVSVLIREGQLSEQGTVLELRARDYECEPGGANPQCASGARQVTIGDRFASDPVQNWLLETLEIKPGAKLNLTNRAGFQFQADATHPETVYVRNLILRQNAILNTALQALYYESLTLEEGAQIVDQPLLGFSLGIIAMNDTTASPHNEFDIRIRKRLRDSSDAQDCQCEGVCPDNDPPKDITKCKEGSITRIADARGPGDGVMEMRTQVAGGQSASSVAAKGAFARAGDEDIVIAFEYLFESNPNAEIVVKLSDKQDVDIRSFEVARVRVPSAGTPGSIGSGQFAVFYAQFPRVLPGTYELNFTRGTYVELELRGTDSRVWIDNVDPQVICRSECVSYDGVQGVTEADFLILLAKYSRALTASDPEGCLDSKLSRDYYVDWVDLMNWDTYKAGGLNSCGSGGAVMAPSSSPGGKAGPSQQMPADGLLISGKPNGSGQQSDLLYTMALDGTCTPNGIPPAGGVSTRANGRLVRDSQGKVYQFHGLSGLVRLEDGQTVIPPRNDLTCDGKTVYVGIVKDSPACTTDCLFTGLPLADAAFHPTDNTAVYVVPVLVRIPSDGHTYRAAAKLRLSATQVGQYSVERLYGMNPYADPNVLPNTPDISPYDVQRLREIDLSRDGSRILVTSAKAINDNDWLLICDEATGAEDRRRSSELSAALRSPIAMLASSREDKVYMSTSAGSTGDSRLFRLNLSGSTWALDGWVDLAGMRQVTSIVENRADGSLYAVGLTFDPASLPDKFNNTDPIFTQARWAMIAPGGVNWTAGEAISSQAISGGSDLALPLSAVFLSDRIPADFNGDGDVDADDRGHFESCATGPGIAQAGEPCRDADLDADGDVDQTDFAAFQRCFSGQDQTANPECGD